MISLLRIITYICIGIFITLVVCHVTKIYCNERIKHKYQEVTTSVMNWLNHNIRPVEPVSHNQEVHG